MATAPETQRRWAARCRALLGTLLVAAALIGCKSRPVDQNRPPLTQEERDAIRVKPLGDGDTDGSREPMTIAVVHRLAVPLDRSAAGAWSLVDEAIFPPVTRAVWHNNGMRVGMMDGYKIARFADALPGTLGISRTNRLITEVPSPLIVAPRQREPIVVDLTIPPRAVQEEVLARGTTQLLAQMRAVPLGASGVGTERSSGGGRGLRVRLIPHQHVPQVSLTPRQPLEKALDGRLFEELALTVDLPADRMLVLGLYRDPPEGDSPEIMPPKATPPDPEADPAEHSLPPDDLQARGDTVISAAPADEPAASDAPAELGADTAPEGSQESEAADDEAAAESDEPDDPVRFPPLEPNLGRALFAGKTLGRPVQFLLLISVETVEPGAGAAGRAPAEPPPPSE